MERTVVDVLEARGLVKAVDIVLLKEVLIFTSPVPDDEGGLTEDELLVVVRIPSSSEVLEDVDDRVAAVVAVLDVISPEEVLEEVVLVLREVLMSTAPVPEDEL